MSPLPAEIGHSGEDAGGAPTSGSAGSSSGPGAQFVLQQQLTAPKGAVSACVHFAVDAGSSPDFVSHFDDLSFHDAVIFADGFETGDTSAWSQAVP